MVTMQGEMWDPTMDFRTGEETETKGQKSLVIP